MANQFKADYKKRPVTVSYHRNISPDEAEKLDKCLERLRNPKESPPPDMKDIVETNLKHLTAAEDYITILYELYKDDQIIFYSNTAKMSFIEIAKMAIYNDALSRLIKVLDTNNQSFTFKNIYNQFQSVIDPLLNQYNLSKLEIDQFYNNKLKTIRDKTHMHNDVKGVNDMSEVFAGADIKWDVFKKIVISLRAILGKIGKEYFDIPGYYRYGGDLESILKAAEVAGILKIREGKSSL